MNSVLQIFVRVIGSIACASVTLIIWDVGTRSPSRLIADIVKASRNARALFYGAIRFLVGLLFAAFSVALMLFVVPENEVQRYTLYEIGAFLTALAVEFLIGDDVRRMFSQAVSR